MINIAIIEKIPNLSSDTLMQIINQKNLYDSLKKENAKLNMLAKHANKELGERIKIIKQNRKNYH